MTEAVPLDPWAALRPTTQARIGLPRAGMGMATTTVLELSTALAAARDAVHVPLDTGALLPGMTELGLGTPIELRSRATDRALYLRRPDLGRVPEGLDGLPSGAWDVGFVIADGLSSRAVADHAVPQVAALVKALGHEFRLAPPVLVTQARVAIGDWIGEAMGVRTLLVLIGERPGLSVADSLGIYLTHEPRPGRTDAERNCISNIHPPAGLGYAEAAATAARLVAGARALGRSGVDLKDTSGAPELP
ncbi:ethanolamine ammonia-lyase subunit EutC [Propionicicella superfundia]|uniref:ethanolamine ammonia-lyase subunit EutC n=1 Tax=Propionicicella superfundia TaxID=348582 RepID=UPI000428DBB7|nr:ethanolamine ammonia-lyase subunit EutC [Propionicicella superfundia]